MPFDQSGGGGGGGGGGGDPLGDLSIVLFYLLGAEKHGNEMFSTYTATQAFDAACRLTGVIPAIARERMKTDD